MTHNRSVLLLVPLLAALAAAAWAHGGFFEAPLDMPMGPGAMPMPSPMHGAMFVSDGMAGMGDALPMDPMQLVMLATRLELTPEQRSGIGRVIDDVAPKLRDLMFRMADARDEFESARTGAKDDAALRALADAQGKLHADMLYLRLSAQQRVRRLLTDEQRAKLDSNRHGWRGPHALLH
jgi:Spy/CpxP family protein refolding chaperone